MLVEAIKDGYYAGQFRNKGNVFEYNDDLQYVYNANVASDDIAGQQINQYTWIKPVNSSELDDWIKKNKKTEQKTEK